MFKNNIYSFGYYYKLMEKTVLGTVNTRRQHLNNNRLLIKHTNVFDNFPFFLFNSIRIENLDQILKIKNLAALRCPYNGLPLFVTINV